jgi:hypothetical protein
LYAHMNNKRKIKKKKKKKDVGKLSSIDQIWPVLVFTWPRS